jgi:hypothetical protein
MSKNKLSPEERLKRYKAYLKKMAEKEGRELSATKSVQEVISKSAEVDRPHGAYDRPREPPKHTKVKRQSLVSPSKRELDELKKAVAAKARAKKTVVLSGRSLSMLRVRSRALAKALTGMKVRREKLERRHDRGVIDQNEYQRELAKLVSEGHELLREKTEIDEEIKILETKPKKK